MPNPRPNGYATEFYKEALDRKSSRAYILRLEGILQRLRDYANTFDPEHDGKLPLAGVYAILDEAE